MRIFFLIFVTGRKYQLERITGHGSKTCSAYTGRRFTLARDFNNSSLSRVNLSQLKMRTLCQVHVTCVLNKTIRMQKVPFLGEVGYALSNSLMKNCNIKQRFSGRSKCFLSSDASFSSLNLEKLDKLGVSDGKSRQYEHRLAIRSRADYKSGEYDITGQPMDSLESVDVPNDAIVLEADAKSISPWWEQFPKRWLIVLLCFTAFLLCNMDRVRWFPLIFFLVAFLHWTCYSIQRLSSAFLLCYFMTWFSI